jgi:succinate dehydrogenase / fumarate reductase cytochrome b subunit
VNLTEPSYRRLRRLHGLSGIVPVGLYIVAHFLGNATAIQGPAAFNRLAQTLDRLPGLRLFEILVIALPILAHIVLGVLLGNAGPAFDRDEVYPRPWMRPLQRATGGFLAIFVIFHVWGTRLSPQLLKGEGDLFGVMSKHLEHPGVLVLHLLGVLAAAAHLSLGLVGTFGYWDPGDVMAARARTLRVAWMAFLVMSLIGINALLAFVTPRARWLEPRHAIVVTP